MDDYDDYYGDRRPRRPHRMTSNYTEGARMYGDRLYDSDGSHMHRTRSQGQGREPQINIYNDMYQGNRQQEHVQQQQDARGRPPQRVDNYYAPAPPPPPQQVPYMVPQAVPQVVGYPVPALGVPYQRGSHSRSRSRSRSDVDERIRLQEELWRARERERDGERKLEHDRTIAGYREHQREEKDALDRALRDRKAAEDAEDEKIRQAIRDRKAKEEKEEADFKRRMREAELEAEAKKEKEKKDREEVIRKYKQEEEDKKAKEKKEWEEFELKRLEKEAKEKKKKQEEDEQYSERVRKDLSKFGLTNNQIEAVIHADEKKGKTNSSALVVRAVEDDHLLRRPTYPKIKLTDIEIDTLKYYGLQWEYDRHDRRYILILEELTERETDILFEHTRRLRTRETLAIESSGKSQDKNYAFVRHRSKSRGKSPSRREKFAEAIVFGGKR